MTTKLEKYYRSIPKELKPRTNPVINALLRAFAEADEEITTQLQNTKAQLFVKTAEGKYLTRLASSMGVAKPAALGLLDSDFRNLIPNLSFKAKQLTKSFYDTMDVFWGPLFSRANVTSTNTAPFNVSTGDSFTITVDGLTTKTLTILQGEISTDGAATATEMVRILNRVEEITASIIEDANSGAERINVRTNTPGTRGSIEIDSGSLGGMGFETGRHRVTDLSQRTVLYQVNPGEIIIELPSIVPTLRRTLKGSHHWHSDETIEEAVAPATKPWQGSFLYSTQENSFVVTATKGVLQRTVLKGSVISEIVLDDTTGFPEEGGKLIFDFGRSEQEQPVDYIAVPNSKTLLIDPGHTFSQTHSEGSEVNLIIPRNSPYEPRISGVDLGIYMTSPGNSRTVVQGLLETLAAAGVTVTFVILLPEYKYLITNPYA